jgi:hypothetical protein
MPATFPMWDYYGRFSYGGGGLPSAIINRYDNFDSLLKGANEMDAF